MVNKSTEKDRFLIKQSIYSILFRYQYSITSLGDFIFNNKINRI